MAKTSISHVCQQCGGAHRKWSGRCDHCGAWNTLVEERVEAPSGPGKKATGRRVDMQPLATSGDVTPPPRMKTGMAEFDRVAGGGLVAGSATLIGGDPGIGKSTLLLQLVCRLSADGRRTAYVSGEESAEQVRMRARRLGLGSADVELATSTNAADIAASIGGKDGPEVVVIDSIQTMYLPTLDSAPGTVSQVRATAQELIRAAKTHDVALLVVGHVTKDGAIAGPRVLEHMVDTVLYFEGDRSHHFRILRGVKNRFGATDEIGVFEMAEKGLVEVPNPSELFLADRRDEVTGAVVFAGIEGSRPVLVEIEALVAPSSLATPRRNVVGWDSSRLAMLTAVLEARCGVPLSGRDIFLNVAGGMKIGETAADLAVAAALLSSVAGRPAPPRSVFFGEVALSAELRQVAQADSRLKEASKLGFDLAVMPRPRKKLAAPSGLSIAQPATLAELIEIMGGVA
ncbi:MAG: DNA repair protein RadA [Pseudomonadota bacterium]|nr:DNA repair protein RadA [Pseudomonadota bacterium]MEC7485749.1 DNA repair protein RadA [Pseudomonadota bacterium]MEC7559500.1 DNA repair protein RadA [Pseudomonadota bacterium]MEC7615737.1 DNA repair protein RadA [Pseudomonadota bacterium]MEC8245209.1 DNA repair protein RadA [Pseudomonadota bacterium]